MDSNAVHINMDAPPSTSPLPYTPQHEQHEQPPPRYTSGDRPAAPRMNIAVLGRTASENGIPTTKHPHHPPLMHARTAPSKVRTPSKKRTPFYLQPAMPIKECVCQCRCDVNGDLAMRRLASELRAGSSSLSKEAAAGGSSSSSLGLGLGLPLGLGLGLVQHQQQQQQDEQLSTEDLSWRRLHMSRAKLKATATTSELLSGFAMVAMVELQINPSTSVPEWLFITFSITTTVLVAVHIFALMISTYLLPNIDAVSKLHVRGLVAESPHERMRGFIELAWAFSTILGLFLFLVEVGILCWVKFWDTSFTAAWASTIIVVPVLVVFVAFAVYFYHTLVVYKVKSAVTDIKELEDLKLKLDSVSKSASLA